MYNDEEDDLYKDSELDSEDVSEATTSETFKVPEDGYESPEDEMSLAKTYSIDASLIGDLEVEEVEDEDSGETYSPEERIRLFADQILASCVSGDEELRQYAINKLMSCGNPRLFRDENYILFTVLFTYRSKLRVLRIDEEFLRLFLNRNRGLISRSKEFIDINAYGEVDGSVELGYIGGVVKHFTRLKGMPEISVVDFETCFEKYLIEFKSIEADKVYSQGRLILTEGMRVGRKQLFGFEDSSNYIKVRLAEIEGLVNPDMGTGFTSMRDVLQEKKDDGKKPYKIGDFDRLTALNDVYGGIYTSMFYQVLAPPKAGKTKFCARVCHTVAVKYGYNVTVWAQEGGKEAWTAQMRAIHFDYTYNTDKDFTERKYGISQDVILNDKYPSEEIKELELSSKRDLESNLNYGNVDFIDRPFVVETFLDDIDTSVKANNSQLVIVDYLQLIGSARNLTEREAIATAYRQALVYCKNNNIAFLTPGQFKQEVIGELVSKKDDGADVRIAGGGSSEVFRTPDVIITLWASVQDLANNTMKILSAPARMSKAFPDIDVIHELSVCQFISVNK